MKIQPITPVASIYKTQDNHVAQHQERVQSVRPGYVPEQEIVGYDSQGRPVYSNRGSSLTRESTRQPEQRGMINASYLQLG